MACPAILRACGPKPLLPLRMVRVGADPRRSRFQPLFLESILCALCALLWPMDCISGFSSCGLVVSSSRGLPHVVPCVAFVPSVSCLYFRHPVSAPQNSEAEPRQHRGTAENTREHKRTSVLTKEVRGTSSSRHCATPHSRHLVYWLLAIVDG
jgi:hypothetical protein